MCGIGCDVFVGITLEVNKGDVFEGSALIFFTPFGITIAVGANAGSKNFPDVFFVFEILTEGSFLPRDFGVCQNWLEGHTVEGFGHR